MNLYMIPGSFLMPLGGILAAFVKSILLMGSDDQN